MDAWILQMIDVAGLQNEDGSFSSDIWGKLTLRKILNYL